jgi:hypothetical protein
VAGPLDKLADWTKGERRYRQAARAQLTLSTARVERTADGQVCYQAAIRNDGRQRVVDVVVQVRSGEVLASSDAFELDPGEQITRSLAVPATPAAALIGIDVAGHAHLRAQAPPPHADNPTGLENAPPSPGAPRRQLRVAPYKPGSQPFRGTAGTP